MGPAPEGNPYSASTLRSLRLLLTSSVLSSVRFECRMNFSASWITACEGRAEVARHVIGWPLN
jgi:hypothetical protein